MNITKAINCNNENWVRISLMMSRVLPALGITHTHTHEFITFIAARLILITNGKIHRISRRSLFQLISIRFLLQSKTIAKYLGLGRMYLFVLNFNCVLERERKSVKPAKCWCCFTCFMTSKVTKAPESALYDPENTLKTFPMKCRMHR